jgi:hypothetical protein
MMPQTSPPPNALAAHYAQSYSGAYNPLPMPKRKDSGEFKKLLTSLKEQCQDKVTDLTEDDK